MARYLQKRKRSSGRPYASKKRKTFKRSRRVSNANYTALNTRGAITGFRGKKTSRRAYKNHLWNSSLFGTHYRSIKTSGITHVTPANAADGTIRLFNMYRHGNDAFWVTAGGLQPHDTGITQAVFGGDITLRGGVWRMEIQNNSASAGDIRVRAFIMNSVSNPNFTFEPTSGPSLWDPSGAPDFLRMIGKPYKTLEAVIEENKSWTFGGRFKIQKIDEITYGAQGYSPIVILCVSNVGTAVAQSFHVSRQYNLSFAGNAL